MGPEAMEDHTTSVEVTMVDSLKRIYEEGENAKF